MFRASKIITTKFSYKVEFTIIFALNPVEGRKSRVCCRYVVHLKFCLVSIINNTMLKEWIRVMYELTELLLAQLIFGLTDFHPDQVLSQPYFIWSDWVLFGSILIWNVISFLPSFISTEFLSRSTFMLTAFKFLRWFLIRPSFI